MPYEINNNVWLTLQIEMDFNLMSRLRVTYSSFDLLSDIGGLSGMLFSIFAIFMRLWMHNFADNHMVSNLYKIERTGPDEGRQEIQKSMVTNWKELVFSWLPCNFLQNRRSKKLKAVAKARESLRDEVCIVHVLKSIRYLKYALRIVLPDKKQRKELKELSAYKAIDLDVDEAPTETDADGTLAKKTHGNDSQAMFAQTYSVQHIDLQDVSLDDQTTSKIMERDYD